MIDDSLIWLVDTELYGLYAKTVFGSYKIKLIIHSTGYLEHQAEPVFGAVRRFESIEEAKQFCQDDFKKGLTSIQPCPFCGSRDVDCEKSIDSYYWMAAIKCNDCKATGPVSILDFDNEQIAAWNRRAKACES